ncbi:MAG: HypC/HybG/HupF family hydrogenase formation chaperone [Clostridiales Family XIII bacterium]|jgi:hydrogenase expression/formation protein HypC|nr:HypC/HybG/HupF family hydrogenase formation chaperone [Clostridiales Family XIII bacterium]
MDDMCVAYPGKVKSVSGTKAEVDFAGSLVTVDIGIAPAVPGDYVLVHAGMAIDVMDEEQALLILEAFSDIS